VILPATHGLCVNVLLNNYKTTILRKHYPFAEKPPWTDWHKIWHRASSHGHDQLCQTLCQSGDDFRFCVGLNFWHSHSNEMSPLTQGLNCRSACDDGAFPRFIVDGDSVWIYSVVVVVVVVGLAAAAAAAAAGGGGTAADPRRSVLGSRVTTR